MDEELAMAMAAAASSECSSGCQSGWTTYLDDHSSSYSYGTARFNGKAGQAYYCDYSEEDDLSMISDASSGPRQQSSAGNDVEGGSVAERANAERRGRRDEAAAVARRQSKRAAAAAAAASLLEDTASSPAFFGYSKAMGSAEANGYCGAGADAPMMEIANAADYSYAFSTTTTGFKSPLNGTALPLGGYMQMQYSPAAVNPMPTRQASRGAPEKKRW